MVKAIIKKVLPASVRTFITRIRTDRTQQRYGRLSLSEAFDCVYTSGAWGTVFDGKLNSGIGSRGMYVEEYVSLMERLLRAHHIRSVADLGCGDFATGQLIAKMAHYTGVDVAPTVIRANTRA